MSDRRRRYHVSPVALLGLLLCLGGSAALCSPEARPRTRGPRVAGATRSRLPAGAYAFLGGERITLHEAVAPFYAARAYAPAWADGSARDTLLWLLADAAAD